MAIICSHPHTKKGDGEVRFEEKNPTDRKRLSKHIKGLIRAGHFVFLVDSKKPGSETLVKDYDGKANEWVLATPAGKRSKPERVPAAGTKVSPQPILGGG